MSTVAVLLVMALAPVAAVSVVVGPVAAFQLVVVTRSAVLVVRVPLAVRSAAVLVVVLLGKSPRVVIPKHVRLESFLKALRQVFVRS